MPTVVVFTDSDKYAKCVIPFLEANETENGLFLGVLSLIRSDPPTPPPVMIQIKRGQETIAAVLCRARYLVVTRGLEGATEMLAAYFRENRVAVSMVAGSSSSADEFAETWSRIRGCKSRLIVDQGLYWLETLSWPPPIAGRMRPMIGDDIPLVAQWIFESQRETAAFEEGSLDDARKNAEARLRWNMTFVWEVDGAPVSMAALSLPSRRGIMLNAVYTPPEFRGRGYGTALSAFVTAEGLKRGKEFCWLYTDLAHPVSNSIYQKIGYRLFSHSRVYRFQ